MKGNQTSIGRVRSSCSPRAFRQIVDPLLPLLTMEQRSAVKATPFYHLVDVSDGKVSHALLKALIRRYRKDRGGFMFGNGLEIAFAVDEVSFVLGLQYVGQYVHERATFPSTTVATYFEGKVSNVTRANISRQLSVLAGDVQDRKDFARLFALLAFNCVLFPTIAKDTPAFMVHYVDDLDSLGEYAWGKAVHKFLVHSLNNMTTRSIAVEGCTFGLSVRI